MTLEIEVFGEDAVTETTDLKRWIERERIREIKDVEQRVDPPGPGEQGPVALAILKIALSSAALVKLVESVHVWIKSSRKKVTVKIKDADGNEIEISTENVKDLQEVIDAAKGLSVA